MSCIVHGIDTCPELDVSGFIFTLGLSGNSLGWHPVFCSAFFFFFFFQAEDGIRDADVTGVQTCALPICTPTWGHLEYMDHDIGLNVHWTSITDYFQNSKDGFDTKNRLTGTRFICGKARTNLAAPNDNVNFAVRASDMGEPGVFDEFDIQLTQEGTNILVYTTNLNLLLTPHELNDGNGGGGNIQLHGPAVGTTPGSCPARVAGAPA